MGVSKMAALPQMAHSGPPQLPPCLAVCGVVPKDWPLTAKWLLAYLREAPKLLLACMTWVTSAPEDSWSWPEDYQPPPLPPRQQIPLMRSEGAQLRRHVLSLVRRRIKSKQKPPPAYGPDQEGRQPVNGHLVQVSGVLRNRDRGVPVILPCMYCAAHLSYTRRSWYAHHVCVNSQDDPPKKKGSGMLHRPFCELLAHSLETLETSSHLQGLRVHRPPPQD